MKQFDIKSVYTEWREMKKLTVKESTMATYTSNAEKHILPLLGSVSHIDETLMQDFVLKLTDSGLSPRTVKDIFLVLRMLMEFGRKRGMTEWRDWDVKMPQCAADNSADTRPAENAHDAPAPPLLVPRTRPLHLPVYRHAHRRGVCPEVGRH